MNYGNQTAKAIRQQIKTQLGYSSRKVSVRQRQGGLSYCFQVTVKDLDIPLEPIEKIARKFKEVDKCERTGEILGGGNTYVFVEYDWKLKYAS